jgi:hypothetical protein
MPLIVRLCAERGMLDAPRIWMKSPLARILELGAAERFNVLQWDSCDQVRSGVVLNCKVLVSALRPRWQRGMLTRLNLTLLAGHEYFQGISIKSFSDFTS